MLAVVLVVLLARATAVADGQHVQTEAPRLMCVPPAPSSTCIDLMPGRFVDEGTWGRIDEALRTTENEATKLRAENTSLRKSAEAWQPGWITVLTLIASGFAGGWYAHSRL